MTMLIVTIISTVCFQAYFDNLLGSKNLMLSITKAEGLSKSLKERYLFVIVLCCCFPLLSRKVTLCFSDMLLSPFITKKGNSLV